MGERIQRHAEVIVDHSTSVEAGDDVLLEIPAGAEDLAEAIAALVGERGASLHTMLRTENANRIGRAYLDAAEPDDIPTPEHTLELIEASDVAITVRGGSPAEFEDLPEETVAAHRSATAPITEARMNKEWGCGTQYPAESYAQRARMSLRAYQDFVWSATNRDWEAVREHQAQLAEILEDASEVRIVSGEITDIRASIDGMLPANDYGERNLPGGEVYTAPVIDGVDGEVLFDVPIYWQGQEFQNVQLTLSDNEVVEYEADEGAALLEELFETDDGFNRFGELGFGMNRQIDRPTKNILMDEKMGDTVHMALGKAYPWNVGEGREVNESDYHLDLVVDMSEDARIEADGETIYEDGWYVFEEGFRS